MSFKTTKNEVTLELVNIMSKLRLINLRCSKELYLNKSHLEDAIKLINKHLDQLDKQ